LSTQRFFFVIGNTRDFINFIINFILFFIYFNP
jgi:hypothetical protein